MNTRFFKNYMLALVAAAFLPVACNEKEDAPSGAPEVKISVNELSFEQVSSSQTLNLTATRDWKTETTADWLSVDPAKGSATSGQTITVTVLENTGTDRTATVKFDIGFDSKTLTVTQSGPGGSSEGSVVYSNDFDKETATKTYGTNGSSWPYLDQFEGWKNATGSGAGSEEYSFKGMSVRANSASNSTHSDYQGSGSNNMFFGTSAYFSLTGVTLPTDVNYTLTFGAEKYSQDNGSVFNPDEFHVYISNDGKKWVELQYAFPDNVWPEGRWNLATTTFTVPSGTSTLGIYVKTDVASSYRLDDLKLSTSAQAGTEIDFSKGVDLGGGDTPTPDPGTGEEITVADFIKNANTEKTYILTGLASNISNSSYKGFNLTDETGTVAIAFPTNLDAFVSKMQLGSKVKVQGKYAFYSSKNQPQMSNGEILSCEDPDPYEIQTVTIKDLKDKNDQAHRYRLTGTVNGSVNANYGSFNLKDATDEIYVYSLTNFADFKSQLADGVTVTLTGEFTNYYTTSGITPEIVNATIEKVEGGETPAVSFTVSPLTLNVAADATSATFNVTSNVDWSVTSDNSSFSVDKATGNGSATVTVSFPANTETVEKVAKITVTTENADVTTKSYTVVLTQAAYSDTPAPADDFSSNVTWTLGDRSYSEKATVNGVSDVKVLKLGSTKGAGTATITIPAGTKSVSFYAVSWKNKKATGVIKVGDKELYSKEFAPNDGAVQSQPYTLTVTDSDKYTIDAAALDGGAALPTAIEVTVTTTGTNTRIIVFGIKAE